MPPVGYELTISVLERAKTLRALGDHCVNTLVVALLSSTVHAACDLSLSPIMFSKQSSCALQVNELVINENQNTQTLYYKAMRKLWNHFAI
jgi:hypothetical protein